MSDDWIGDGWCSDGVLGIFRFVCRYRRVTTTDIWWIGDTGMLEGWYPFFFLVRWFICEDCTISTRRCMIMWRLLRPPGAGILLPCFGCDFTTHRDKAIARVPAEDYSRFPFFHSRAYSFHETPL
jgi:hypothetical protein